MNKINDYKNMFLNKGISLFRYVYIKSTPLVTYFFCFYEFLCIW
ncbi:protein of unknown function [Candidatus Nitrosocosmicus franklandus]|uniref:Uncharacterized protein n=1 Tax=Candidatus Nitrosocosmicus franklandianus TaxID=1798806 RepID=A0A484I7K3_9ARCH|nr:protein of unknown function [Candidatus Nitrosocosmicus franklandus]